jgi:predicted nucleotidyltransferase
MILDRIEQARSSLTELCRKHSVRRLSLFGSAAGAGFDAVHSDLDFIVEFVNMEPRQYAEDYFGLWEDLQSLFGRPVDLITAPALQNPYLRQAIEQSRIDLYAA